MLDDEAEQLSNHHMIAGRSRIGATHGQVVFALHLSARAPIMLYKALRGPLAGVWLLVRCEASWLAEAF